MSQIKLKHSGGNGVIIAAPSSNPAADRTLLFPSDGDGTILTTNSAVGSWIKLSTTTITSNVSDVTFTNSITDAFDTYKMYSIVFSQLQPSSDGVELRMRIQEGGSTDTGSNYRFRVFSQDGNETAQNADKLRLNKDPLGNDTSGSAILGDTNGIIYMTNFEANRLWKYYGFHMFLNNAADKNFDTFGGGVNGTNATTGVLLYPENGSWASGTVTLYGIAQ